MCVQVMKTANRFEISSLLEDIIETSQVVLNFCRTIYIILFTPNTMSRTKIQHYTMKPF